MGYDPDDTLRQQLETLLEGGLQTQWQQRAYSSEAVNEVVAQLQRLAPDDYEGKLATAGFTPQAYCPPEDSELEQQCATCMYYERNRQYCNLPELAMPVLPHWSCKLWRI
jgi:hypothetical protein